MSPVTPDNELREKIAEELNSAQHAPMYTHGHGGDCLECPVPLYTLSPDEIADTLVLLVEPLLAAAERRGAEKAQWRAAVWVKHNISKTAYEWFVSDAADAAQLRALSVTETEQ